MIYAVIALALWPVMSVAFTVIFHRSTKYGKEGNPSWGDTAFGTFIGAFAAAMWPLAIVGGMVIYATHGLISGDWKIQIREKKPEATSAYSRY